MSDSLESWRGEGAGAHGADILDLDRYVRGVRGGAPPALHPHRQQLVVDAGGVDRLPAQDDSEAPSLSTRSKPSIRERPKRFSHDSGVSDDSYRRTSLQRHRSAKLGAAEVAAGGRAARLQRDPGSSESRRAFRAQCEHMLRDQQEQIAKVAQFCERITAAARLPRTDVIVHRAETTPARGEPPPSPRSDTSDLSSSSRDTRELRRRDKDKRRTDECKTYKIIMTKLDELNRLFVARTLAEQQLKRAMPRRVLRKSSSVSVRDKIVATEPGGVATPIAPNMQSPSDSNQEIDPYSCCPQTRPPDPSVGDSTRRSSRRTLLREHNASPRSQRNYTDRGENGDRKDNWIRNKFKDNSLPLYVQARRLESYRAESVPHSARSRPPPKAAPPESVCGLLAKYWRALRQCLLAHFCPEFP